MIALLLSALLLLMLTHAFVVQWQAFRQQSQLTFLHQTAIQSHTLLQRELSQSGFWAGLGVVQVKPPQPATQVQGDCHSPGIDSGSFPLAGQIWLTLYAGTVGAANTPACLTNAVKQSDFIQLKHLAGDPLRLADLRANRSYLQQNGLSGRFIRSGDAGLNPQLWYWPYRHELYYVARQTLAGELVPVLMRKRLVRNQQGNLAMDTAAVLDGVEMIAVEIGLDLDADGLAEQFIPASQLAAASWGQRQTIRQIRYFVLLRALQAESGYRNQQRYQLGQRQFQARGDPYRRLLISSSVKVAPME
ncbi:PilW family protein [Rheinheimera sp.]|uniref:PilW family protein n=1 Tax=Rheinheimera sp. TaxID=1869214 RepID=UPI003D2A92E6